METVTVSGTVDGPPAVLEDRLYDFDALMQSAGFDEVHVDDDRIRVVNAVGLATLELTVEVVDSDAALAYEQVDGMFDEMMTRYELEPDDTADDERTAVTITTEFALGTALVGDLLDATVITRQRRSELEGQLAYLDGEGGG
ncbi:SRPBCC family protein [Halostella salina]|uniref:SRPBCC family protein n=1 Tax=Halostella salina TaxID=1547897 RepID=UPI000EF7E83A|nr:SRPBCC family protein [Halostella salina]